MRSNIIHDNHILYEIYLFVFQIKHSSIFEGMGIRPNKYCPRVDNMNYQEISDTLKIARQAIQTMVKNLPTHDDFLRQNCNDFPESSE